jgi:glycosyltransferase involved in cell wall biosynthesis
MPRRLQHRLTAATGLFDREHYLDAYPDVADSGADPLEHYCYHGWREGRAPGPRFAPELHPRRRLPGINPLLEWWLLGRPVRRSATYSEVAKFLALTPAVDPPACDVAFIVHECTRTGAPLFLLRLARWLRETKHMRIRMVILAGGPLLPTFCAEFDCILPNALPPEQREARLRTELSGHCSALYFNSLASLPARRWFSWFDGGIIIHCHEGPDYLVAYEEKIRQNATPACRFIAVTQSAAGALQSLAPQSIVRYLPPAVSITPQAIETGRDPTLILGCGTASLRKGADLFCQIARQLIVANHGHFRMVWIGGPGDANLPGLIKELGLASHVTYAGEVADPRAWFEKAALLLMPSREDPFPLASLEAAERALPTLCFDTLSGGIGTFANAGAAVMVPAYDLAAMSAAITSLLDDPTARSRLGAAARAKVCTGHNFDIIGQEIADLLVG